MTGGVEAGERLLFGCMTGTSIDALDACAVAARGHGLAMSVRVLGGVSRPQGSLAEGLRRLAEGGAVTAGEVSRLALAFGELHAEACDELAERYGGPELVAVHGQTVFHAPPSSWQMVNPWPVAERLGCAVVSDLRGADLARGGQGAPITPIADWVMFRSAHERRAVVNLGGFCNITLLGRDAGLESGGPEVGGRDVCACNHLLDGAARAGLGLDFDPSGENALRGRADPTASDELAALLSAQSGAKRSLGTGDESRAWIEKWAKALGGEDLVASAVDALGRVIAGAATKGTTAGGEPVGRVILAGGGAMNRALVAAISRGCEGVVQTSEALGVGVSLREAAQMAVLGALSRDGVAITLTGVTGVRAPAPISGAWIGGGRNGGGRIGGPGSPARCVPAAVVNASEAGSPAGALPDRGHVLTEQRNPRSAGLDAMSVGDVLRVMNGEDATVAAAVGAALERVAAFVEALEPRVRDGGRLVYFGAGTSGRLGVLDASEVPPTFQAAEGLIVGVIAGGDGSLRKSSEGREDEPEGVRDDFERLGLNEKDTVLGIAAGGTTPYVIGGLRLARERGALTGMLACARAPAGAAEHVIEVITGPEVLTGSTRLKAGTATKLVLNMITTALMVRLGKAYDNLMVDLRASNAKLTDRAARIVSALTGEDRAGSLALLEKAGGEAKVAVVMRRLGVGAGEARARLAAAGGRLRGALQE